MDRTISDASAEFIRNNLVNKGYSKAYIAGYYGVTYSEVDRFCKAHGIRMPRKRKHSNGIPVVGIRKGYKHD